MNDLNRATIMGNLTRDPELRQTPNGQSVTSFSIATNRRWNNQAGEQQEEVEFHDVVAWGKLAEICAKVLFKGRKAYIEGRLKTRSWEGQDGVKRTKTEIIADNVIAVGAPKEGSDSGYTPSDSFPAAPSEKPKAEKPSSSSKKAAAKPAKKEEDEEINLDDIPF